MKRKNKDHESAEIRQFRKKIIGILSVAFLIVIIVISAAFFISYRSEQKSDVVTFLEKTIQGGGENREKATTGEDNSEEQPERGALIERTYTGIVLLAKDESTDQFLVVLNRDMNLADEEAIELGQAIYEKNQLSGREGNDFYLFEVQDGILYLAITDISAGLAGERTFLIRVLLLLLIIFPLILFFSFVLSGWLVRPMREAMEKQLDFIFAAGHELKTPLTVMNTSFDMMERDGIKSRYLDYARSENEQMTSLVSELLDLSRIDAERGREGQWFDISSCVEGAVLPFETTAYEKGAVLQLDIEEGIMIKGRRDEIAHAAGILTDNAVRHAKSGEEGTAAKIRVSLHRKGQTVLLTVANEGDPIPEEEREKIFLRFYRVDKTGSRQEGRYGLGLAIAQSIAERHGGSISVSCRDGWTSFVMALQVGNDRKGNRKKEKGNRKR